MVVGPGVNVIVGELFTAAQVVVPPAGSLDELVADTGGCDQDRQTDPVPSTDGSHRHVQPGTNPGWINCSGIPGRTSTPTIAASALRGIVPTPTFATDGVRTMTTDRIREQLEDLSGELKNFQEIARYLNPSPGEVPRLKGIEISGLSMPLRDVIGGDHILYIDFDRRYDLDRRIAEAKAQGRDEVAEHLGRCGTAPGSWSRTFPGTG